MAYRFNVFTSNFDDIGTSSAVPTYANFAAFPGTASDGALAVALDTDLLYVFNSATSTWKIANPYEPAKIALYDNVTTSLTTGAAISSPFVVDGVTVTNGMLVLFSNLGSGNNEVYSASISGSTISWSATNVFTGQAAPSIGDTVIPQQGTLFANQIGQFNGTTWKFNETVRYYRGSDYSEQDAITTVTLTDATSNGTVFSIAYLGSENILLDFSLNRGGSKENGTLSITTDGVNVAVSAQGAATQDSGVSFSGIISGSDLILRYTTTSTGSDAVMKFVMKRWSDNAGGPTGVPSYSSSPASVTAAGSNSDIQFNSSGVLAANSNFAYDGTNNILSLGGLQISILESVTLADNQAVAADAFTSPVAYDAMIVEYSVSRGSNFRTGTFLFSTDGVTTSFFDDYVEQGTTGVVFSSSISGGLVHFKYTSTSTGTAPVFKYSFRRWSA